MNSDEVVFFRERTYADLFLFLFMSYGIMKYEENDIEVKGEKYSYCSVFMEGTYAYDLEIRPLKGLPILLSDAMLINETLGPDFFRKGIRYSYSNFDGFSSYDIYESLMPAQKDLTSFPQ